MWSRPRACAARVAELARADRVLYILDAAAAAAESSASDLAAELDELPKGVPVTLVFNKIDLSGAQPRR